MCVLDEIERMVAAPAVAARLKLLPPSAAASASASVLRLDGTVACDVRSSLVARFNRPAAADPSFLFLLSAKVSQLAC